MGLPKINQPLFEVTIPSTGKKTTFRPFTVKEEKILLIAQESKDLSQAILAMKQIINNCVNNINPDDLAMFDLEYLLINLRSKSVNNVAEFMIEDPDTNQQVKLEMNLDSIEVKKDPSHTKIVKLDDSISLEMDYPKINQLDRIAELSQSENKNKIMFDMMMDSIKSVIQDDTVMKLSDFSDEEVQDFLDSLSSANIIQIKKFFDTMPVLRFEQKYKLKDGTEKTFVAEGTQTFFI